MQEQEPAPAGDLAPLPRIDSLPPVLRTHRITITNFCLGKHLVSEGDLLKDQRGSPAYISPDVLSGTRGPAQGGSPPLEHTVVILGQDLD